MNDRIWVPALIALGVGAGTLLPVLRQLGKSGRSGLTFHKPRKSSQERAVGAIVGLVGLGYIVWGILYAALGGARLGVLHPPTWVFGCGVLLDLTGVALLVTAQTQMGRSWRIGIDPGKTDLVTHGVYGFVRNPIYFAVILLCGAMCLLTPCWPVFAGALTYWVFIQIQIRYEERHLSALHGAAYARFMAQTGRLLPLPSTRLNARERATLLALGQTVIPGGVGLPSFDSTALHEAEKAIAESPRATSFAARLALRFVSGASVLSVGGRFHRLPPRDRERWLERGLARAPRPMRLALRGLVALVKNFYLENNAAAVGSRAYAPVAREAAPWQRQMKDGAAITQDEELEADVAVVGTGAGGAPLAYELAARGHAVLLIEEGRYFGRNDFTGKPSHSVRTMFRDQGLTLSFGNTMMPVWTGVTVGGSTTVNSGTCYRAPDRTFADWRSGLGLEMFSSETLAPYYERVEAVLGVAETDAAQRGGSARVLARGASKLGLHGAAIRRNAPGCDGQGRCMWGCPTGAKRSTDVSYVPQALERGAQLYSRTRAETILVERGQARGIVARTQGGARLTVRARATVLACGSLMTPILLQQNRLALRSGMVGRNLSVHPAAPVLALFDEAIDMQKGVPQSWAIEDDAGEGLMIEESGNPPEVVGVALPLVGHRFVEVFGKYRRLAQFGYMIKDSSRGSVSPGHRGSPRIRYSLNDADTRLLQRGCERVSRLFLEAGARAVFPAVRGFDSISNAGELSALSRKRLGPGDFQLSAVHPLGTARMGLDGRTSVVNSSHECHDVRDLFVVDGSAVPTALGVNPQLTIMAMATRAADLLNERL